MTFVNWLETLVREVYSWVVGVVDWLARLDHVPTN